MKKLTFRYGAMNASKSAQAIMTAYNYKENGKRPLIIVPDIMLTKDGRHLKSRIGIEAECIPSSEILRPDTVCHTAEYDAVIVDEAQFLTTEEADLLTDITDDMDIPVICYGLKTDFTGKLFEGSKRLLELADDIEEIPTICWCGRKARFNARVVDGKVVSEGEQVKLGGNESYRALCREHYFKKMLAPDNINEEGNE